MLGLGISFGDIAVRQRPAGFSPFDLGASLLGFWDAEAGITLNGGNVSAWADRVAGYTLTQATGAAQPAYNATALNGRPVIVFDGADDFLTMASQPFPSGSTGSELWFLLSWLGGTTLSAPGAYGGTAQTQSRTIKHTAAHVAQAFTGNGSSSYSVSDPGTGFTGAHVVRGRFEATSVGIALDGGALTTNSSGVTTNTSTIQVKVGATVTDNNLWNGPIVVAIVTSLLTDPQATALATYLKARGGIA